MQMIHIFFQSVSLKVACFSVSRYLGIFLWQKGAWTGPLEKRAPEKRLDLGATSRRLKMEASASRHPTNGKVDQWDDIQVEDLQQNMARRLGVEWLFNVIQNLRINASKLRIQSGPRFVILEMHPTSLICPTLCPVVNKLRKVLVTVCTTN